MENLNSSGKYNFEAIKIEGFLQKRFMNTTIPTLIWIKFEPIRLCFHLSFGVFPGYHLYQYVGNVCTGINHYTNPKYE
jgi:hypothetical protein